MSESEDTNHNSCYKKLEEYLGDLGQWRMTGYYFTNLNDFYYDKIMSGTRHPTSNVSDDIRAIAQQWIEHSEKPYDIIMPYKNDSICLCKTPIVYKYIIEHRTEPKHAIIGSVCIKRFGGHYKRCVNCDEKYQGKYNNCAKCRGMLKSIYNVSDQVKLSTDDKIKILMSKTITFGKYHKRDPSKAMTYSDVFERDRQYFNWMFKNVTRSEVIDQLRKLI